MVRHCSRNENPENIVRIINIFYDVYGSSKSKTFDQYRDEEKINVLKQIFLMENHYFSYENYIVHEEDGKINGIALVVCHQDAYQLKVNSFKILSKILNITFDLDFEIETESKVNEVYLDTFGVESVFQGQGIGTKLIAYIIDKYVVQTDISYLSLNVSFKNHQARRLYERLGFHQRSTLSINYEPYYHMVKELK